MDNSFKVNRGLNLLPQTSTPTNPANGDLYYDSVLNKFRKYENGLWSDLGSGSGSGKNYLGTVNGVNGNGDFEMGATTKWSLFNTTLTSLIPTGTITAGAASITTFDTVSSAQLSGTYSLRTASSGAWAAGSGFISDAFTLDESDRAKVMSFRANYKVFSGATNGNFSGTSSNTFAIYFYDVANSQWIQPSSVYGLTQNSGSGSVTGSFQTSSNATTFRMAVVAINASGGAISMYWDDFSVGPQTMSVGAVITDWVTYTPTLTSSGGGNVTLNATASNLSARWRRVGDSIQIGFNLSNGTGGAASGSAGNVIFGLPTGITIDTTKQTTNVSWGATNGVANYWNGGATTQTNIVSASSTGFLVLKSTAIQFFQVSDLPASATMEGIFVAPVVGWSSTVQVSNDTDTRVVAARYNTSTSSIAFNSDTVVVYTSKDFDTHSAYSTSTGRFTAPITGKYSYQAAGNIGSLTTSTGPYFLSAYKNGIQIASGAWGTRQGAEAMVTMADTVDMIAGDYLEIRAYQNDVASQTRSMSVNAPTIRCFFAIERVSGPSTIAVNETVGCQAYKNSGSHTANAATQDVASWAAKVFDTHGAFNLTTGQYVVPAAGVYHVSGTVTFTPQATSSRVAYILQNGVAMAISNVYLTFSDRPVMNLATTIRCNAGDIIKFSAFQASGGSLAYDTTVADTTGSTRFNIHRVGI